MIEDKKLDDFLESNLKNRETVAWKGAPDSSISDFARLALICTTLGIVLDGIIAYTLQSKFIGLLSVFSIPVYLHFLPILLKNWDNIRYIATNERILIITDLEGWKFSSIRYHKIHQIVLNEKDGRDILFYNRPVSKVSLDMVKDLPRFLNLPNPGKVLKKIKEVWKKKGPYTIVEGSLKNLAKKYNLKYQPYDRKRKSRSANIQGTIGALEIMLEINGRLPPRNLQITIQCPNPNDNFLSIRQETFLDSVNRIFGEQNFAIGDKDFDETFVLQSNNPAFMEAVLGNNVRFLMEEAQTIQDGIYRFGAVKSKRTQGPKISENPSVSVFDYEMLSRLGAGSDKLLVSSYAEDRRTPLIYTCTFYHANADNPSFVSKSIIKCFESTLTLAKAIEDYYA